MSVIVVEQIENTKKPNEYVYPYYKSTSKRCVMKYVKCKLSVNEAELHN